MNLKKAKEIIIKEERENMKLEKELEEKEILNEAVNIEFENKHEKAMMFLDIFSAIIVFIVTMCNVHKEVAGLFSFLIGIVLWMIVHYSIKRFLCNKIREGLER